jgi:hypothetical protein
MDMCGKAGAEGCSVPLKRGHDVFMQRDEFGCPFHGHESRSEIMITFVELLELDWDPTQRTQRRWQGA